MASASDSGGVAEALELTWAVLQQQDASTSNAVIAALENDHTFLSASEASATAIRQRDDEDDEKLALGIEAAIAKKVLPDDLVPQSYHKIDVLGKTPDEVARGIIGHIGEAANTGCVIVMCGLSGTGKGTTVARMSQLLPNSQTWSNGNVFRALTLLCVRWCAKESKARGETVPISAALTPENLAAFMKCLSFGPFAADGDFDTRISSEELGVNELVGDIQNTILKGPEVGSNIPTVAEQTQGEVINFVSGALDQLAAAGKIVLLEGAFRASGAHGAASFFVLVCCLLHACDRQLIAVSRCLTPALIAVLVMTLHAARNSVQAARRR